MKKLFGKLMALILSVMVLTGLFASCELVSVNVDKDMEQKVATVQVDGYNTAEDIYKRELVSGFVNYGYTYMQYYGYTLDQVYDLILNNLINNKVIVQYSKLQLESSSADATDKASYLQLPAEEFRTNYMKGKIAYLNTLLPYVSKVQVAEAVYNTKMSLNQLLDSIDTSVEEKTEEVEDETIESLTTPTVPAVTGTLVDEEYAEKEALPKNVTEEELDANQLSAYDAWRITKFNSYSMAVTTTARKGAVSELVDTFASNGLIGEKEYSTLEKKGQQYNLNNYSYYLDLLTSSVESFLITNYEDELEASAKDGITDEALWSEYVALYNSQKAKFDKDLDAFESAVSSATEDSFNLYTPAVNGYGYVANILIGFSDDVTAALNAFKGKATTNAAVEAYRDTLLLALTAKDQRATWVQNGYYEVKDGVTLDDTNKNDTNSYEFGDDYAKHLKAFDGTFVNNTDYTKTTEEFKYYFDEEADAFVWGDKSKEDYTPSFKRVVANEISWDAFLAKFDALLGCTTVDKRSEDKIYDYEGTVSLTDTNLEIIKELLFAYNTDPGGHNSYNGYLYSPKTSAEQYVKEFAEAAKLAVEAGVGAYYIVATDYGYHIIIYTKVLEHSANVYENDTDTDFDAFSADLDVEDTLAYKFKQKKIDSNVESLVSDIVTYSISKYINEEHEDYAVTKHEKALKNLLAKAE